MMFRNSDGPRRVIEPLLLLGPLPPCSKPSFNRFKVENLFLSREPLVKISRLFRYPVKSLRGLEVEYLELDDFGPIGDRRWMIVDAKGRFVTQRKYPQLALLGLSEGDDGLEVAVPGAGCHALQAGAESREVVVWEDRVEALIDAGAASSALSGWLGEPVQFVYMPDYSFRRIDPVYVAGSRRVSFADGFPFLVINQSSLDQLSGWVGRSMDVRRFRPGILVSGAGAFAEDGWSGLRIGTLMIDLVKPCARCVMTTVDPDQGSRDPEGEPLKTLRSYRNSESGILFGVNGVHRHSARIQVGDEVIPVPASEPRTTIS